VPLTLIVLNPKSICLDSVQNYYYCVKFQVILIRGFRFTELTYPQANKHTNNANFFPSPCS